MNSRLAWQHSQRLIPARFSDESLFKEIAAEADWQDLECLSDLSQSNTTQTGTTWGQFKPADCAAGIGANLIMAAFVNMSPSRFSDGTYGVYYAGRDLNTAIDETVFHKEKFARDARLPATHFEMQALDAKISGSFFDLRKHVPNKKILSPGSYVTSQQFSNKLRNAEQSPGIVYPSVRSPRGECVAVFLPWLISNCHQTRRLTYRWNGIQIFAIEEHALIKSIRPKQ